MKDDAHQCRAATKLRAAWRNLNAALNTAEVLLLPATFGACVELFEAYDAAVGKRALAKDMGLAPGAFEGQVRTHLREAKGLRRKALEALQMMIGMDDKAREVGAAR